MKTLDVRKVGVANSIKEAIPVLRSGGVIIYPTDTVYGLGADAENPKAVLKVYRLKNRPRSRFLTIAVCDLEMAGEYANIKGLEAFLERFLPGAATFILPKTERVIPEINPRAIGIRIPESIIVREIVKGLGRAITSTSANRTSNPPPHSCLQAVKEIPGADLALDCGVLLFRRPSTIVDLTRGKPSLVREGPVSFKEIMEAYRSLVDL
ncbi:MAG: threonylcarbamoyl-AMP synthase [Thermoproteota archaeon]|nr:MAG: threonylcarbamoyl-AMP synthase [Candidatus Korarchaeota archaeon]RLG53604.1 MAG: threonylcarbamoyl-AMP synthase [Candidatus Korarchaeota archaeon]